VAFRRICPLAFLFGFNKTVELFQIPFIKTLSCSFPKSPYDKRRPVGNPGAVLIIRVDDQRRVAEGRLKVFCLGVWLQVGQGARAL
jgi:hypothetical protein